MNRMETMDKNFIRQDVADDKSTDWYNARQMKIHGLVPDEELMGCRVPREIAMQVSEGVLHMSWHSTGARIRFSTESSYIALKAVYGPGFLATVNNHSLTYGFDLYRNEKDAEIFTASARPVAGFDKANGEYKMLTRSGGHKTAYTLYFPSYTGVKELWIGVEKGCSLTEGKPYRDLPPVVYYGSSITHGACAGRPGNIYENFISQKYNLDYVNLGFAGHAKGEQRMAEYIAGLSMSAFACDYDHNAPDAEHLEKTHFAFYETIRQIQPDLPYIMISRPTFFMDPVTNGVRRQVIMDSYEKAKALGDRHVYFIDGETLFEGEFAESCTNDGVHPNDLGFYRMAQKIGPVIAKACGL